MLNYFSPKCQMATERLSTEFRGWINLLSTNRLAIPIDYNTKIISLQFKVLHKVVQPQFSATSINYKEEIPVLTLSSGTDTASFQQATLERFPQSTTNSLRACN